MLVRFLRQPSLTAQPLRLVTLRQPCLTSYGGRTTSTHLRQHSTTPSSHSFNMASFPSFTTSNFYAGNALNRLSWLRPNSAFLNTALTSPSTRFIILQSLNPLVHGAATAAANGTAREGDLATLRWNDVKAALGATTDEGIFGPKLNGLVKPDETSEKVWSRSTDGVLPSHLALVFLGVDERGQESSLPGELATTGSSNKDDENGHELKGTPYFALSLTHRPPAAAPKEEHDKCRELEVLEAELEKKGYEFVDTRALAQAGSWEPHDAAVVAQARSLLDWSERQHVSYKPAYMRSI